MRPPNLVTIKYASASDHKGGPGPGLPSRMVTLSPFEKLQCSKNYKQPRFGFMRLWNYVCLDVEPNMVVMGLSRELPDFKKLLEKDEIACYKKGRFEDNYLIAIICVLGEKVCSDTVVMKTKQLKILNVFAEAELFRQKLVMKCGYVSVAGTTIPVKKSRNRNEPEIDHRPERFFSSLTILCKNLLTKLESKAFVFLGFVLPQVDHALQRLIGYWQQNQYVGIYNEIQQLMCALKSMECDPTAIRNLSLENATEDVLNGEHERDLTVPPGNFRSMSIYPTENELRSVEDVFIRANIVSGAYENPEHYLDVQFRLLREDFVRPLRQGFQKLIDQGSYVLKETVSKVDNLRIFHGVEVLRYDLDRGTPVYLLQLDDKCAGVEWVLSDVLMSGALLMLSSDDFQTVHCATVYRRGDDDLERNAQIQITLQDDIAFTTKFEVGSKLVVIEYDVFFEAYRHTLQVLKEIPLDEIPLAKFIVNASTDVCPPKYLSDNTKLLVGGRYINPLADSEWPTPIELGMDEKQFVAYKACLTKEFVIVQGPPGTGKTYLGLQVVNSFLDNRDVWRNTSFGPPGPILVVCYTNHALDQFMEGILKLFQQREETPSLIRVGGMSKSGNLAPYTFMEMRNTNSSLEKLPQNFSSQRNAAYGQLRSAEGLFECLVMEVEELEKPSGIAVLNALSFSADLEEEVGFTWMDQLADPTWYGYDMAVFHEATDHEKLIRDYFPGTEPGKACGKAPPLGGFIVKLLQKEMCKLETSSRSFTEALASAKSEETSRIGYIKDELCRFKKQLASYEAFSTFASKITQLKNKKLLVLPEVSLKDYPSDIESVAARWAIYFKVLERSVTVAAKNLEEAQAEMISCRKSLQELLSYGDGLLLAQTVVIGMTTTGAAKYNDLLKMAAPRIVIVEEAAEVLEAHVVACITPTCQQLILIGDHQQLRPGTSVHDLAVSYNLDISLFERMVKNDLNCYTLKVQHRMRPEICDLVTGSIYSELSDAEVVKRYPHVKGMQSDLYFVSHEEEEDARQYSCSKYNTFESEFIVRLYVHLLLQGYKSEQITILCTYTQQVTEIQSLLRSNELAKKLKTPVVLKPNEVAPAKENLGVRVCTVDSFQGEENDIILLSLVRSNDQGNIGFLSIDNRVCVALTRAKHGMYIVGNMNKLSESSKTWKQIKRKLEKGQRIGDTLPIKCGNHGVQANITKHTDFDQFSPKGGCLKKCDIPLSCGHECSMVCHILDLDHSTEESVLGDLACKDEEMYPTVLPCNHRMNLSCKNHRNPEGQLCKFQMEIMYSACGHAKTFICEGIKPRILSHYCPGCSQGLQDQLVDELYPIETNVAEDTDLTERGIHLCELRSDDEDSESDTDSVIEILQERAAASLRGEEEKYHRRETEVMIFSTPAFQNVCCGHGVSAAPSGDLTAGCTLPCLMELHCGHACKNKCMEPCGPICKEENCSVRHFFGV